MSDQEALFGPDPDNRKPWQGGPFEVPADELARRTDPFTSRKAAAMLGGRAGSMRRILLEVFLSSPVGLTPEEASRVAGFEPVDGAWKRVSDLKNAGLILPTGRARRSSRGRDQEVLAITQFGREALSGKALPEG